MLLLSDGNNSVAFGIRCVWLTLFISVENDTIASFVLSYTALCVLEAATERLETQDIAAVANSFFVLWKH